MNTWHRRGDLNRLNKYWEPTVKAPCYHQHEMICWNDMIHLPKRWINVSFRLFNFQAFNIEELSLSPKALGNESPQTVDAPFPLFFFTVSQLLSLFMLCKHRFEWVCSILFNFLIKHSLFRPTRLARWSKEIYFPENIFQ